MKNIVKVMRLKDNAARLYSLPEGATVKNGTLVSVEYPDMFSTAVGVAVTDSYVVDDYGAQMLAAMHRMSNIDHLKKVVSVYDENPLDWPVEDPEDDEDEQEADQEAKSDEAHED